MTHHCGATLSVPVAIRAQRDLALAFGGAFLLGSLVRQQVVIQQGGLRATFKVQVFMVDSAIAYSQQRSRCCLNPLSSASVAAAPSNVGACCAGSAPAKTAHPQIPTLS
jgi:hypothetical protein